jgi:hypothetical protein
MFPQSLCAFSLNNMRHKMNLLFRMGLFAVAIVPLVASGMTLSSRGTGQVLLYPYYTVNKQQQTSFTVTNTTSSAKVVSVRIREGYNGRDVLDFSVLLSAFESWSGVLFSLADAGIAGSGAGIIVTDDACTIPSFASLTTLLPGDRPYQPLLNFDYNGSQNDTGPTDDSRTREGSIEIYEMAQLSGATLAAINTIQGDLPACDALTLPIPSTDLTPPGGGLAGSSAIVNVAQGTFFSFNASAIDGFFNATAYFPPGSLSPNLGDASVNSNGFVTADIPVNGSYVTLNYQPDQSIDAVSALLMADQIYADFDISPTAGANTDWVITFPTKRFYVDPEISSTSGVLAPFDSLFGDPSAGVSDVHIDYATYTRDGAPLSYGPIGYTPTPPHVTAGPLPTSTQVGSFTSFGNTSVEASTVLGSKLVVPFQASNGLSSATAGSGVIDMVAEDLHQLRPTADGVVIQGLPVIGFVAVNYINGNVSPGVLSNYSGTYPLRTSLSCSDLSAGVLPPACQ